MNGAAMSESMTSVEIEDVLSSIRRLVSEDLRPLTRVAVPLPVVAEPAPSEKLILTPALRVVPRVVRLAVTEAALAAEKSDEGVAHQPDGEFGFAKAIADALESDLAPDLEAADGQGPRPAQAADSSIEVVVAVVGAGVDAQDDWEADDWDADVIAQADDPWHSAGWYTPDATLRRADPASMPEAELIAEAELVRDEGLPRDGMIKHDDDTQAWPESDGWAPDDEPTATVTPHHAAAQPPDAIQRRLADLAEAAAVAEILGVVDAPHGQDAASPHDASLDDAAPHDASLDDAAPDEAHLRDLVRDIIREELQGSLGERITRNVRKLVRAEINRALATRDFE